MELYNKLYDWQKRIVDKLKDKKSYGLFLEMGLGKTPLSLALCEANRCTKLLIVSINAKAMEDESVKGSFPWWIRQSDMKDFKILNKYSKTSEIGLGKQCLIVNYESLFKRSGKTCRIDLKDNLKKFIESCHGETVGLIVDESHKLKTYQSMQTQSVIKLQKLLSLNALVHTYLLTGTPFTTGYLDLWTQLKVLGCKMTKGAFIDNFCVKGNLPGLLGYQQPIVGYKNLSQLFAILHEYAITIKSEEVANLPEAIFMTHDYPQSVKFNLFCKEKINEKILKKDGENHLVNNPYYRNIAYPELKWIADTTGTFWLRARQLSIGFQGNSQESKWFDSTRLDMLKNFLELNPDNYVLFYSFTSELLELYDICDALGYNIDCYSGEIKSLTFYEKYANMTDARRLTNKKNIILANWQSGSTGVNWQEYDKCIIFDLPVYRDYTQGLARIRRLGQKSKTTIYHIFIQNNWLDRSMIEALKEKKDYTEKTFASDIIRVQNILEKEDLKNGMDK